MCFIVCFSVLCYHSTYILDSTREKLFLLYFYFCIAVKAKCALWCAVMLVNSVDASWWVMFKRWWVIFKSATLCLLLKCAVTHIFVNTKSQNFFFPREIVISLLLKLIFRYGCFCIITLFQLGPIYIFMCHTWPIPIEAGNRCSRQLPLASGSRPEWCPATMWNTGSHSFGTGTILITFCIFSMTAKHSLGEIERQGGDHLSTSQFFYCRLLYRHRGK